MTPCNYANATLVAGIALTIVLTGPPVLAAQTSPKPATPAVQAAPAAPDHDHEHPEPAAPGGGTPAAPGARSAAPT